MINNIQISIIYMQSYAIFIVRLIKLFPLFCTPQAKILGDYHTDVISTLCAITACYCAIESLEPARTYADLALACISASAWNRQRHDAEDSALAVTCPPLVPLLKLSIWLCWKLGRDKKELEARLHELKIKGYDVDGCPTLLELVINWFKS